MLKVFRKINWAVFLLLGNMALMAPQFIVGDWFFNQEEQTLAALKIQAMQQLFFSHSDDIHSCYRSDDSVPRYDYAKKSFSDVEKKRFIRDFFTFIFLKKMKEDSLVSHGSSRNFLNPNELVWKQLFFEVSKFSTEHIISSLDNVAIDLRAVKRRGKIVQVLYLLLSLAVGPDEKTLNEYLKSRTVPLSYDDPLVQDEDWVFVVDAFLKPISDPRGTLYADRVATIFEIIRSEYSTFESFF